MDYNKIGDFLKRSDLIPYFIIGIYIFLTCFTTTSWYVLNSTSVLFRILKYLRYLCYLIFLLDAVRKIYQYKFDKSSLLYLVLLLALSFIGIRTSEDKSLFLSVLFFFFIYTKNSKKVLKVSLFAQSILLFITVFCAFLGLTDNSILDTQRMRYSLGFSWSTFAPALFFFIVLQYLYIRKSKIQIYECAVLEGINIFLYEYTNTKMSFVLLTLVLCIQLLVLIFPRLKSLIKKQLSCISKIITFIPLVCALISYWIPFYSINSKFYVFFNSLLSNRLNQSKNAILKYGFTFFGTEMNSEVFSVANKSNPNLTYFVDSGFLHFGLKYGILVLILLVFLYCLSIKKAYLRNDYYMVCIFIVISLFCINDLYLVHAFNIFIVYLFCDIDLYKLIKKRNELSLNETKIH